MCYDDRDGEVPLASAIIHLVPLHRASYLSCNVGLVRFPPSIRMRDCQESHGVSPVSDQRSCLKCGASLPADAPQGVCPKCLVGAAVSKTVTHRPAARQEAAGPPASRCVVDLAEFQRSIVEIGLIEAEELARFVVTPDEVSRLAGALMRAGKLTAYQAAALAQGKAKGLLIGDYLVMDKLGQGGMGVVFKARHRPTGHVVAMKVLPPSFGRDREAVQRFRREVEIASRLDHPNLVAALDASEVQGVHFLTMEYISGYDLDRLVTDGGPLPVELALHCTIHAARGLAAAHAQGIIHRDVKPANVMLDDKGSVRVLDLGLARVVEAGNLIGGSPIGSLTQSGAYMGTVDFMAPEQADDPRKVDHRADIYSLGCTLYFLLTGRPPFLGDTVLKRLMAHQERPAPPLRAARPEVSERLEAAYLEMMAKRPAERPDSMAEVIDLLEACRSSPENEEEARSGLTIFATRAFKRAVPRGRDRGPDASIFARRPKTEGLQFDPDLRFEDLVMDLREEMRPEPLTEEKLPPIVSRPLPKRVRRRRSTVPYGLIAFALVGVAVAGYAFRPQTKQESPEAALARNGRQSADSGEARDGSRGPDGRGSGVPAAVQRQGPERLDPAERYARVLESREPDHLLRWPFSTRTLDLSPDRPRRRGLCRATRVPGRGRNRLRCLVGGGRPGRRHRDLYRG